MRVVPVGCGCSCASNRLYSTDHKQLNNYSHARYAHSRVLEHCPRALVRTSTHTHAILPEYADILNADRGCLAEDIYFSTSLYCMLHGTVSDQRRDTVRVSSSVGAPQVC